MAMACVTALSRRAGCVLPFLLPHCRSYLHSIGCQRKIASSSVCLLRHCAGSALPVTYCAHAAVAVSLCTRPGPRLHGMDLQLDELTAELAEALRTLEGSQAPHACCFADVHLQHLPV